MSDYLHYCKKCNSIVTDKYEDEIVCENCLSQMISLHVLEDVWDKLDDKEKRDLLSNCSMPEEVKGSQRTLTSVKPRITKDTADTEKQVSQKTTSVPAKRQKKPILIISIILCSTFIIIATFMGINAIKKHKNVMSKQEENPDTNNPVSSDQIYPNNENLELASRSSEVESDEIEQVGEDVDAYISKKTQNLLALSKEIPSEYTIIKQESYVYDENGANCGFDIVVYRINEIKRQVIISFNDKVGESSFTLPSFFLSAMSIFQDFQEYDENISIIILVQRSALTQFMIAKEKGEMLSYGYNHDGSEVINDLPDWIMEGQPDELLVNWINDRNIEFWNDFSELGDVMDPSKFIPVEEND